MKRRIRRHVKLITAAAVCFLLSPLLLWWITVSELHWWWLIFTSHQTRAQLRSAVLELKTQSFTAQCKSPQHLPGLSARQQVNSFKMFVLIDQSSAVLRHISMTYQGVRLPRCLSSTPVVIVQLCVDQWSLSSPPLLSMNVPTSSYITNHEHTTYYLCVLFLESAGFQFSLIWCVLCVFWVSVASLLFPSCVLCSAPFCFLSTPALHHLH